MEGIAEVKSLIEKQGQAWEEFKKTNDALIAAKADGKAFGDLEAKLVKVTADLDKLAEMKSTVEAALTKINRPDFGSDKEAVSLVEEAKGFNHARKQNPNMRGEIGVDEYKAYKSAFWNMVRKGRDSLEEGERKAMIAGDDANGGYFLPPPTVGRIVKKLYELSPIRAIATVQPISTSALAGLYDNDQGTAAYVGEIASRTNTTTPTLGKYRLEAFEIYANPKASQTLLDDAAVDVEAWLADKIANKFGRFEASEFINGIGANAVSGFAVAYTLAATGDATRTWGQIEKVKTGANGDFAASSPADKLFDLLQAFKTQYLNNAKWVTTREVIAKIRKFKEATTNAYMWQPGLQQGTPDSLLGYPIVMAQDVPALATGSASLWMGDWKEAYTIVDRQGMRTIRDNLTDKPNVQFYTTARVGGGVLNFEAIKAMTFEA
jgi:HK97 family phage major capsid protein